MRTAIITSMFLINIVIANQPVTYLFSHGLGDSHKQAWKYTPARQKKKPYIIQEPLISFDYPDVSKSIFRVNRLQTSLAQDNEIKCLAQNYYKYKPSVLVGVSRGASALINFMGIYQPTEVGALILESPFDCVNSIVDRLAHETRWAYLPGLKKYGLNIMSFIFCKYRPDGIRPIDQIAKIAKDLPILIICSAQDTLVPVWSTINVYKALIETGHSNTYLLVVPEGKHAELISHRMYGTIYQHVVHAFYCKHNLPHDQNLARKGSTLLNQWCQPDLKTLQIYYPQYLKLSKSFSTKKSFTHDKKHKKSCCVSKIA